MKYFLLIVAVIAAACSVPPNAVRVEPPISPEVVITAPREEVKEVPKPKPKVEKQNVAHCKDIDTGDLNETINQKIDCLLNETAK